MGKVIGLIFAGLLIWSGAACGHVENAERTVSTSKSYSEAEIHAAMDTAAEYFRKHFNGCTLMNIRYEEERVADAQKEWAEDYHADQAIVLLSDFETGDSGGDGSLNRNAQYMNWQWILARDKGEKWTVKDCGY